jgi:hypothetical protein
MTAGIPFPQQAQPYTWEDTRPPPQETLRLWTEVGNGIDKSQTGEFIRSPFSREGGGHFLIVAAARKLAYSPQELDAGATPALFALKPVMNCFHQEGRREKRPCPIFPFD